MSAPVLPPVSFALGQIVATPGAIETTTFEQRVVYLRRHLRGDWGKVCGDDWELNDAAARDGDRILSA